MFTVTCYNCKQSDQTINETFIEAYTLRYRDMNTGPSRYTYCCTTCMNKKRSDARGIIRYVEEMTKRENRTSMRDRLKKLKKAKAK